MLPGGPSDGLLDGDAALADADAVALRGAGVVLVEPLGGALADFVAGMTLR
jgi:hypothetical protein